MKLQNTSGRHARALFATSALALTMAFFVGCPVLANAQDSGAQLSQSAAEEQVPAAFPDINIPTAADNTATTQNTNAGGLGDALAPGEAPAEPEAKKLVPATAMGAAAQNVESNKQGGSPEAVPNPVEDTPAEEDSVPALPDILEKFTAKSDNVGARGDVDALPSIEAPAMSDLGLNADAGMVSASGQTQEQLQEEIRTEAYDAAITGTFPLSPGQVKTLLKRYDETQEAVKTPVYKTPKPEITVQNVSLDPGIVPPTIKTAVGNVTTINMLDATGAPWPVQDVTWAGDFEVVEPEEGGHIIRITPMEHFARGNIVIRLLTLKTPLTMTLETSRETVQYRVDARIPEYGPFAAAPLMQGAKSTLVAGSPDLTSLLDGVMPGGMQKLQVSGVDGRTTAYNMGGTTYIRTPLTLMSPAWHSSVSSADGMNVYALTNAPVLLLSDGGEFMRATLQEKEDLLDE